MQIERVHVVFKTHFDLGFTGAAADVLQQYLDDFIPRALDLAEELDGSGPDGDSFVWTTGSWLIREYLRTAAPADVARMDRGIRAGRIAWHALPCSTHTELLDAGLVRHGLSIGRDLDARFGTHRVAAKLTDVPGHTVGLVPLLAEGGVEYLHVGVNPASALPAVPPLFRWRAPSGAEIVVQQDGDYGSTTAGHVSAIEGMTEALYLAHTNDNAGPPSSDAVRALFRRLRAEHPGARVQASTLDAFAAAVRPLRDRLPVVTDEIGDSWIAGVASDPLLLAQHRALLRLRTRAVADGTLAADDPAHDTVSDHLLLVAEHTWGKDQKAFLPDYVHYDNDDFDAARRRDVIDPAAVPDALAEQRPFVAAERPLTYRGHEASWADKRAHIAAAVAALPEALRATAAAELATIEHGAAHTAPGPGPVGSDGAIVDDDTVEGSGAVELRAVDGGWSLDALGWRARFDGSCALTGLWAPGSAETPAASWFDVDRALGRVTLQTFGPDDQDRWIADYCRQLDRHHAWALPDQSRLGLRASSRHAEAARYRLRMTDHHVVRDGDAVTVVLTGTFPDVAHDEHGAPRQVVTAFRFPDRGSRLRISVTTVGRRATRLPEATWVSVRPRAHGPWTMEKLGVPVDPTRVVAGGGRRVHAAEALVTTTTLGRYRTRSLDAPLVAFGTPTLLDAGRTDLEAAPDAHVLLHDNVWSTNFRQWFEDDLTCRFDVDLGADHDVDRREHAP